MTDYEQKKKLLDDLMCKTCHGSGKCDDSDLGDIYFNTWTCKDCNGTGWKNNQQHVIRIAQ